MSGMYDLVFQRNPQMGMLCALLSTQGPIEKMDDAERAQLELAMRLRDAWLEKNGEVLEIHLYTRVGGANRPHHAEAIEFFRTHPWYDRDSDDDYDSTYAGFWFRINMVDLRNEIRAVTLMSLNEEAARSGGVQFEPGAPLPDEMNEMLDQMADHFIRDHFIPTAIDPVDTSLRWKNALDQLGTNQ